MSRFGFTFKTLDQQQVFTEEELKEFESHISQQESDLKKKTEELQKQKEELQRQHDYLQAQKQELQQVWFTLLHYGCPILVATNQGTGSRSFPP